MKVIPLTQGYFTIVDDKDYEELSKYSWQIMIDYNRPFPKLSIGRGVHPGTIYLHHELLPKKIGFIVDHKDGNTLNNCRSNLRYATYAQNKANSKKLRIGISKYKGVSRDKRTLKWRARIGYAGYKSLGVYTTEEAAARAYDKAAMIRFGVFARLNFPQEREESCLNPGYV